MKTNKKAVPKNDSKIADEYLTIAYLLLWGIYTFLGMIFGKMFGEDPMMPVLLSVFGLVLILQSMYTKNIWIFLFSRFVGISLCLLLVYFDVWQIGKVVPFSESILEMFMHPATWGTMVYLVFSVSRIFYMRKELSE